MQLISKQFRSIWFNMDPILEKIIPSSDCSFTIKEEILPYVRIGWHFHPEYELTLFTESTGKRFVGDNIGNFEPGDLLLIGPGLPHYMRNDDMFYKNQADKRIRAIVVHFPENFLGDSFFNIPEMTPVKNILTNSRQGVHIFGKTRDQIAGQMENLLLTQGYERLKLLLDILDSISHSKEYELLSSLGFKNSFSANDADRINKIFDYLFLHFQEEISLEEVGDLVHMSTSNLCKFFKSRTGKTFTHVLNEIRIGYACKLFLEKDYSVSDVCYKCGFNSLSYFNRRFKHITKYSPLEYQHKFYN